MADYIKRVDALKAATLAELDADFVIEAIHRILAADVRPVVLCKNCKYFHKESGKCLNIDGMAKQLTAIDFCSCGEEVDNG